MVNTQYVPLAALSVHYQQQGMLTGLSQVLIPMKERDFSAADKLPQVLLSILSGCTTLSEVNPRLKSELGLTSVWGWERFADQSSLSRTLDALTLMNIEQLQAAVTQMWRAHSLTLAHDWRGYLWLDFDLSGLPCGKRAQASQKGYFSGEKTPPGANWRG